MGSETEPKKGAAAILSDALPAPDFKDDGARRAYAQMALAREPDIEGTKARAQRLIARFPKVAAYLR